MILIMDGLKITKHPGTKADAKEIIDLLGNQKKNSLLFYQTSENID